MQKKRLLQDLVEGLAVDGNLKKKDAEDFVRHFFKVVEEGLLTDRSVKVNGLGTFKLIDVEARSSVDVNTGQAFLIKEHLKVSFVPDTELKDMVNKPFAAYEPMPTPTPTASEAMKETQPDHQELDEKPIRPQATPLDETPLGSTAAQAKVPELDDPFDNVLADGERQPTIQEMLEALEQERQETPGGDNHKRRRSLWTIILITLGLFFLAGLIYWSIDSNQKARQERALKEQLMKQLVVDVEPLTAEPSQAALDSLAMLSGQVGAAVKQVEKPTPVVKPTPPKPAVTTAKPTVTPTKTTATTTKPSTTTASKPTAAPVATKTASTAKTTTTPTQVTVQAGDRLTQLAEKHYGHKVFWVYIYLENKDKIPDPNNVAAGTTLVLPKAHPTLMDPGNPEAIKRAEGVQQRILARY